MTETAAQRSWPVSETLLRQYGKAARDEFDAITQKCDVVVDTFENILWDHRFEYDNEDITKRQVRVGTEGEECHYVAEIDGELVTSYAPGDPVWIDLSFDQFCIENEQAGHVTTSFGTQSDLQPVRILGPGDTRRVEQYMTVAEYLSTL